MSYPSVLGISPTHSMVSLYLWSMNVCIILLIATRLGHSGRYIAAYFTGGTPTDLISGCFVDGVSQRVQLVPPAVVCEATEGIPAGTHQFTVSVDANSEPIKFDYIVYAPSAPGGSAGDTIYYGASTSAIHYSGEGLGGSVLPDSSVDFDFFGK